MTGYYELKNSPQGVNRPDHNSNRIHLVLDDADGPWEDTADIDFGGSGDAQENLASETEEATVEAIYDTLDIRCVPPCCRTTYLAEIFRFSVARAIVKTGGHGECVVCKPLQTGN